MNRKIDPIREHSTEQRTAESAEIECTKLHPGGKEQEGYDDDQLREGETSEAQEQGGVEERALVVRVCP